MLLELRLPPSVGPTATVRIDAVNFAAGDALARNARLIDFTAGLDDAAMHDCPPVTTYRMTLSETAWVRQVHVVPGQTVAAGDVLALLTTSEAEPVAGPAERRCRITSAAILQPMAW